MQRVSEVFARARRLGGTDRSTYLGEACSGDEALLREVESLLAEFDGPAPIDIHAVVNAAQGGAVAAGDSPEPGETGPAPERIGPSGIPPDAGKGGEGGRGTVFEADSTCDLVAGRYRIERFIARGGMGEVYEARDLALDVKVAIKTLNPGLAHDLRALRRFKREVLLARSVSHPNVCRIYDLGLHPGPRGEVPFLSMELLTGESLSSRLGARGRLGAGEAMPLIGDMTAALDAAHRAGVVL
jgi:hypothetical protein